MVTRLQEYIGLIHSDCKFIILIDGQIVIAARQTMTVKRMHSVRGIVTDASHPLDGRGMTILIITMLDGE